MMASASKLPLAAPGAPTFEATSCGVGTPLTVARLSLLELPVLALVVVLAVVLSLLALAVDVELAVAVEVVAAAESVAVPAVLLDPPLLLVALALLFEAPPLVLPPEDAEDPCPLQPASSAASVKALSKISGDRRPALRVRPGIGLYPRLLRQRAARRAHSTLDWQSKKWTGQARPNRQLLILRTRESWERRV